MNIVNLEESLQSSLIEKVPKTQGKTSPKVSNDEKVERIVILNKYLQNLGKKRMTEFRKHTKFAARISLSLLTYKRSFKYFILHSKVSPKPLERNANQEGIHLISLQLIAVTNALAERISCNPSLKRILTAQDLSQTRCYNCNKTGHTAKYCRNRKKSNFTSNKCGHNLTSTKNDPHVVLVSNVIGNELIHPHSSRTYEVFSC